MCKVVYGCCAEGFKDVTQPMSYESCVQYLKDHIDEVSVEGDPHYTYSLDIMNVESGRLMSFSL